MPRKYSHVKTRFAPPTEAEWNQKRAAYALAHPGQRNRALQILKDSTTAALIAYARDVRRIRRLKKKEAGNV